jgi:hypothetical protein
MRLLSWLVRPARERVSRWFGFDEEMLDRMVANIDVVAAEDAEREASR